MTYQPRPGYWSVDPEHLGAHRPASSYAVVLESDRSQEVGELSNLHHADASMIVAAHNDTLDRVHGPQIETVEQLDAMRPAAVVLNHLGNPWQKLESGRWAGIGARSVEAEELLAFGPLQLIHAYRPWVPGPACWCGGALEPRAGVQGGLGCSSDGVHDWL